MLPDLSAIQVRACYEFMATMPPFCQYKLPPSEEIEFQVVRDRTLHGWHKTASNKHHILAISENSVGHTSSLIYDVSHEMIHLLQAEKGTSTNSAHNAEFRKIARAVCRLNGFDYRVFC
jgi:hypothetical protein